MRGVDLRTQSLYLLLDIAVRCLDDLYIHEKEYQEAHLRLRNRVMLAVNQADDPDNYDADGASLPVPGLRAKPLG